MGAQGKTTVDFGAFPGTDMTTTVITGQATILAGSLVEAWLIPEATADHSLDEHLIENVKVCAGNIVAGTGFTIYGVTMGSGAADGVRLYGLWTVGWVWN